MGEHKIKQMADYIWTLGSGLVDNEEVEQVLEELEKYEGMYGEGHSDMGKTVIEKYD